MFIKIFYKKCLLNISFTSIITTFIVHMVRTLKCYSQQLSNIYYSIINLYNYINRVAMLFLRFPELTHHITECLHHLTNHSPRSLGTTILLSVSMSVMFIDSTCEVR